MKRWTLGIVVVALVVAAGCMSTWKTANVFGMEISYKVGNDKTTLVLDSPPGSMTEFAVGKVTFIADKFGNLTTSYTVKNNNTYTFYGYGTTSWGVDYLLFMLFPKDRAVSSYNGSYFYKGCVVIKNSGNWYVSCTHPLTIFGRTNTGVLTDYVEYYP